VDSSSDLPRIVAATRPGSKVTMQLWRNGTSRVVTVVVGEIAEEKLASRGPRNGKPVDRAANRLGLVVAELTAEQKRELKVNGGLLVEEVRSGPARAELRPGDVILAIISRGESTEIRGVEQFNRLLERLDRAANVTLLVRRDDVQTFVTIKGLPGRRGE
ncbi:MAG: protease Do, partial [Candidatus Accumulibacter sp.]|nr:protease Do [Accumulibacter sp.]